MTVTNNDDKPLRFEEAFHSYYAVTDIHEVSITGLEPTSYVDKTDNMKRNPAANAPLTFTRFTDRVYNNTAAHLHYSRRHSEDAALSFAKKIPIPPSYGTRGMSCRILGLGMARDGRRRNREHSRERCHSRSRREPHHARDHLGGEELTGPTRASRNPRDMA